LDVGGGSGAYAIAFAQAQPGLEVVVFDLPNVVPLTQGYVAAAGLSDRITTQSGDYNVNELGAGFDLAFLSAIIHANSPEQNRALLVRCARALNPGGQVVIQDFIMDEDRTTPAFGALFALNMLVGTSGGDTYTEAEVNGWLEACGFTDFRRMEVASGMATTLLCAALPGP
jgi:cyclopropane fatty-acyl-phospholipid synthase-like methyltransferase